MINFYDIQSNQNNFPTKFHPKTKAHTFYDPNESSSQDFMAQTPDSNSSQSMNSNIKFLLKSKQLRNSETSPQ